MNRARFAGEVRDAVALVLQRMAAPPWAVDRVARLPAPVLVRVARLFSSCSTAPSRRRRVRLLPGVGADREASAMALAVLRHLERVHRSRGTAAGRP